MQEKDEETTAEKQKKLLQRLVEELSRENADLYYQPTTEIAFVLKNHIDDRTKLSAEERKLLKPLSRYDIQLLLSLH